MATARQLERRLRGHPDVEITLVSRENFFVITPLLFEACSGRLELRHCAQPIRAALRRARFVEATVEGVDVQRQIVRAVAADRRHLRPAVRPSRRRARRIHQRATDPRLIECVHVQDDGGRPGARNHLIEQFERADAASDPTIRRGCLTVVLIGGGLVGVELLGELTAFADDVLRFYPRHPPRRIPLPPVRGRCTHPARDRRSLADVALRVLQRRGADMRSRRPCGPSRPAVCISRTRPSRPARSCWRRASCPSAIAAAIPVAHDQRGRIAVDGTMRSRSHPSVWALGDCAAIPGPDGRPYPALAQHTVREARQLAHNSRR